MSEMEREPMGLEQALALLAVAHIRNLEDDDYSVQMRISTEVMLREDDYVEAWASVREAVLHRRRMIEEINQPFWLFMNELPEGLRERVMNALRYEPSAELFHVQSDPILRQLVDTINHRPATPREVIAMLFEAVLLERKFAETYYRLALEGAARRPVSMFVSKEEAEAKGIKFPPEQGGESH